MQSMGPANENLETRYRAMLMIWVALLFSVVTLFALTKFVPMPESVDNPMVVLMLGMVAFFQFVLSFVLKKHFLDKALEKRDTTLVQTAMIISLAMCEAICLFGVVSFFVFALPYYYGFFILGATGILLHIPRRAHLHNVAYKR